MKSFLVNFSSNSIVADNLWPVIVDCTLEYYRLLMDTFRGSISVQVGIMTDKLFLLDSSDLLAGFSSFNSDCECEEQVSTEISSITHFSSKTPSIGSSYLLSSMRKMIVASFVISFTEEAVLKREERLNESIVFELISPKSQYEFQLHELFCFLFHMQKLEICDIPMKRKSEAEKKSYSVTVLYRNPLAQSKSFSHFQSKTTFVKWNKKGKCSHPVQCKSNAVLVNLFASPTLVFTEAIKSGSKFYFSSPSNDAIYTHFLRVERTGMHLYTLHKYEMPKLCHLKPFSSDETFSIESDLTLNYEKIFNGRIIEMSNGMKSTESIEKFTRFLPISNSMLLFNDKNVICSQIKQILYMILLSDVVDDSTIATFHALVNGLLDMAVRCDSIVFPTISDMEERKILYKKLFNELGSMSFVFANISASHDSVLQFLKGAVDKFNATLSLSDADLTEEVKGTYLTVIFDAPIIERTVTSVKQKYGIRFKGAFEKEGNFLFK